MPEQGKKEADPKALSFYYAARLLVSRELRLAAQSDNKDFSKAQQALNEILKTPWGKRSIDVQMERIGQIQLQVDELRATVRRTLSGPPAA